MSELILRVANYCAGVMPVDRFWKEAGLWRYFVKEHFLLVPMAPDQDTAHALMQEGDRQMRGVARLWMDGVLDAAIAAAEHTNQLTLRDHYRQVQDAELHARDQEIQDAGRSGHHAPAQDNEERDPGDL